MARVTSCKEGSNIQHKGGHGLKLQQLFSSLYGLEGGGLRRPHLLQPRQTGRLSLLELYALVVLNESSLMAHKAECEH